MIKLIAEGFNSKTDRNGNRYWAYRLTNTQTGAVIKGNLGGSMQSALSHAITVMIRKFGWSWDNVHLTETELPIREFNRLVKGWPYSRNVVDEVAAAAQASSGKRRRPGLGVKVAAHKRRRVKVSGHKRHWPDVLPDKPKRCGGKRRAAKRPGLIAAAKALREALRG